MSSFLLFVHVVQIEVFLDVQLQHWQECFVLLVFLGIKYYIFCYEVLFLKCFMVDYVLAAQLIIDLLDYLI